MSLALTGRIVLPKRWSRAKRKRRRAAVQWMRRLYPAYKAMLDSVWSDPPGFDWGCPVPSQGVGQYLDDAELKLR